MATLIETHDLLVKRIEALGQDFSADKNLKLERITHLLELLGNPQNDYKIIHIGGTSGKGSVATLTRDILYQMGYRTGLFTSPYLQVINESCQINAELLSIQHMSEIFDEILPFVEIVAVENPFGRPSYFEVLLAISLVAFSRENIDIAIVEVGLGGRLDATNVLKADISILVSVGLDHVEILGGTLEEISIDKVQIIKPGQSVICGFLQDNVRQIVQKHATSVGAVLRLIGEDFSYTYSDQKTLTLSTEKNTYADLKVDHQAAYQGHNAICAVSACEYFMNCKVDDFREIIQICLNNFSISGRSEVITHCPLTILDGAHNVEKVQSALDNIIETINDKRVAIVYAAKKAFSTPALVQKDLSIRQDKIFNELAQIDPELVIFTEFLQKGIWQSETAETLYATFKMAYHQVSVDTIASSHEAYLKAKDIVGPDGVILVIGSFHLVGEIRDLFISPEDLLS